MPVLLKKQFWRVSGSLMVLGSLKVPYTLTTDTWLSLFRLAGGGGGEMAPLQVFAEYLKNG